MRGTCGTGSSTGTRSPVRGPPAPQPPRCSAPCTRARGTRARTSKSLRSLRSGTVCVTGGDEKEKRLVGQVSMGTKCGCFFSLGIARRRRAWGVAETRERRRASATYHSRVLLSLAFQDVVVLCIRGFRGFRDRRGRGGGRQDGFHNTAHRGVLVGHRFEGTRRRGSTDRTVRERGDPLRGGAVGNREPSANTVRKRGRRVR